MTKKSVAALWVLALTCVLLFNFHTTDAKAQFTDQSLSLQDIAFRISSPDKIANYLWKNFKFESDRSIFGQEDYWQTPNEFLSRGKGDCEDFAVFAQYLLKQRGISSFILNIYGRGEGHTVCVFKENGKYQAIDGTKVFQVDANSLQELSEKIDPFWEKAAIVSPTANHGAQILTEFSK